MANPRLNGNVAHAPVQTKSGPLVRILWKLFEIYYGLLVLIYFAFSMLRGNKKFRVMDKNDKKDLAAARNRLWDLQSQPFGLSHKFCELRDGTRLHYMLSRPDQEIKGKTGLVIFLHGFPGITIFLSLNHVLEAYNLQIVGIYGTHSLKRLI